MEGYNAAVANIDFHSHSKPDSLIFFAASNDGQKWVRARGSHAGPDTWLVVVMRGRVSSGGVWGSELGTGCGVLQGYGSIQPEAQAKNVLAVGATRTSNQAHADWMADRNSNTKKSFLKQVCRDGCAATLAGTCRAVGLGWGQSATTQGFSKTCVGRALTPCSRGWCVWRETGRD